MTFNESEHPRDGDGRFTDGRGLSATPKERERLEQLGITVRNPTVSRKITGEEWAEIKEYEKLLGEEFKGYKGQAAIDKLMTEKRGHIKGAFHRRDLGAIDLIYGNDDLGLQHIIKRRTEQGADITQLLGEIADTVEKGTLRKQNNRGNFEILYDGKMAIVSPELLGNKVTFLLTAYNTRYKK
jgi:hypothetical protein